MKKISLLLLALVMAITSLSAQKWQSEKCYRGFADIGVISGTGMWGINALTVSTIHGYQVIPSYLFIGGGLAFHGHSGSCYLPLFADFRSQLPTGKWSPFVDARLGYAGSLSSDWEFGDGGLNFNPSVGVSFAVGKRIGLEVSVGYVYQNAVVVKWWNSSTYDNSELPNDEHKIRKNIGGISIRLGISF